MIVPFAPFEVLGKRVLALEFKEETKKSLLILENDNPKNIFIVVSGSSNEQSPVDPGDKILIKNAWTQKVTIQDVEYSIINFDDILGVYIEE